MRCCLTLSAFILLFCIKMVGFTVCTHDWIRFLVTFDCVDFCFLYVVFFLGEFLFVCILLAVMTFAVHAFVDFP